MFLQDPEEIITAQRHFMLVYINLLTREHLISINFTYFSILPSNFTYFIN